MAAPSTKAPRTRIDNVLVERGLVESRSKAQAILMAGDILVDGAKVTKPSQLVPGSAAIEVLAGPAFVSRGGDKLQHALHRFQVEPDGYVCLDVGASTGGFTDCLLQNGASRVYAVDVGYGVLDYRLRRDSRLVVMERTNARGLEPLPEACDLATVDVSFIGVEKVLPAICHSLKGGASLIVLLKPQFQAKRGEVARNGVVKDAQVHAAVIGRMLAWSSEHRLRLRGLSASPLLGAEGNREFLLHYSLEAAA